MADNVDDANKIAVLHLAFELANAKPSLPPLTGRCFIAILRLQSSFVMLIVVIIMNVTNAKH
jgi:hypothetical protein